MVGVTTLSAAERAFESVRDAIVRGTLAPGTMLAENALAEGLGVSRTPVRTALARLQDEGWITVFPKRGALVRGLDDRDVLDLADARHMLESSMVARATPAARAALADRLGAEIDHQEQVLRAQDLDAFIDLTVTFHRSFVEVGGNALVLELESRLADRHRHVLHLHGAAMLDRWEQIVAEHRELVVQLRDDPAEFSRALRLHQADSIAPGSRNQ
ncbi:GntR family transcriptional regulator [Sanguibacter sp. HDW7]|nr:GntR family transcriptional regulator [Sanguibacter sp. HDW7]